ncbi:MAG TPA: hypothetical protein VMT85_06325 [Thermoanaerobaculia bacterium]|nr:hypothetical protein [Thermoanaerobaculia bacterium]
MVSDLLDPAPVVWCSTVRVRLDERERLFCTVERLGEVMLSDTVRFQVFSTADDDLSTVEVAGERRRLRWPESQAPG